MILRHIWRQCEIITSNQLNINNDIIYLQNNVAYSRKYQTTVSLNKSCTSFLKPYLDCNDLPCLHNCIFGSTHTSRLPVHIPLALKPSPGLYLIY